MCITKSHSHTSLSIQYDATKSYATKSQRLKRVTVYCLPSSAQWALEGTFYREVVYLSCAEIESRTNQIGAFH